MVQIDIEMPIYCYDCPCHNGENGRCNITGDSTFDKRPFDCPLKEVKLADLPSAQPARKKGKWIMEWDDFFHREVPVCSQCLRADAYKFEVCPNCGADMREDAVQKKGKWIWHDAKDGYFISAYSCSVCNFFSSTKKPNICPGCGADMREGNINDQTT